MQSNINKKNELRKYFVDRENYLLDEKNKDYNPTKYYIKQTLHEFALLLNCHLIVDWLAKKLNSISK
jgi:hypothetical protein